MNVAVLQARVRSTRLPGKVLTPLMGRPMILRQLERLARARRVERRILATSTDAADDPLAALAAANGVECFRGSLEDVLDRFYQAIQPTAATAVVRLTGDCPLADPELIDQVVDFFRDGDYDYASNVLEPTFPDGLDVEVVRRETLETAWREARRPSEREHVTSFIYTRPERFRLGSYRQAEDHSRRRWTVDEPEDFAFVTAVYEALYPERPAFTTADVLALLARRPELEGLNARFRRNEGYSRSLAAEGEGEKGTKGKRE